MNDTVEIRRENLRTVIAGHGLAEAARRFKKPARQLNYMASCRKAFGEKVAREMEKNYDPSRPPGWLDLPPESAPPPPPAPRVFFAGAGLRSLKNSLNGVD